MNHQSRSPTGQVDAVLRIEGGRVLHGVAWTEEPLVVADGKVSDLVEGCAMRRLDATGLLVLPGIVDIHGDAIERLIAPRPAAPFSVDFALIEADRQLVANGITTAFHAVTWSWEGGQRGETAICAIIDALVRLRPHLAVDTRLHLRHETFNIDAEPTIAAWLDVGLIDCLGFNDHMAGTIKQRHRPEKMRGMIERSGLSEAEFHALVDRIFAKEREVPASIERLAARAHAARVPMLSHDDMSPAMRDEYRTRGAAIAEFPINEETASHAAHAGDPIVFGAPNVVRGGSHTGCPSAAAMVRLGRCTVLASDYYWPALAFAPFVLERQRDMDLAAAWRLVSRGPAEALNLLDRGEIRHGFRADVILVEPRDPLPPRIVATMVAGRIIHLAEPERLVI